MQQEFVSVNAAVTFKGCGFLLSTILVHGKGQKERYVPFGSLHMMPWKTTYKMDAVVLMKNMMTMISFC